MLKLSVEHILLLEATIELAPMLTSLRLRCETRMSGDSSGLPSCEPSVLLTMKICLVRRFCHTAFSSTEGARRMIARFFMLFSGVRVKSGVQFTFAGLLAV
jgi:hypothetical protein